MHPSSTPPPPHSPRSCSEKHGSQEEGEGSPCVGVSEHLQPVCPVPSTRCCGGRSGTTMTKTSGSSILRLLLPTPPALNLAHTPYPIPPTAPRQQRTSPILSSVFRCTEFHFARWLTHAWELLGPPGPLAHSSNLLPASGSFHQTGISSREPSLTTAASLFSGYLLDSCLWRLTIGLWCMLCAKTVSLFTGISCLANENLNPLKEEAHSCASSCGAQQCMQHRQGAPRISVQ